jgi:riboflavin kinase/FMN adenylyltransferase
MMKITAIEDFRPSECGSVCTVGMFDGVHVGHRLIVERLLATAEEDGLQPVVVTFDRHPREVLGDNSFLLLNTSEERLRRLENYGVEHVAMVHFTPEVARLSACEFFEQFLVGKLKAKVLVLGYDNMFGNKKHNDFDRLEELSMSRGCSIVRAEAITISTEDDRTEVSSTQIRKALERGDISLANRMLGYCYEVSGTVVHGRQVGRGLGFPTANIEIGNRRKAMPKEGVYAVRLTSGSTAYKGMANWGGQPTFGHEEKALEVNVLEACDDLYGKRVSVTFVERIRDIIHFKTPEELAQQLDKDRLSAIKLLGV